jgi:aryl-alcohol dehydrogenase-like predicted oxidoreductase
LGWRNEVFSERRAGSRGLQKKRFAFPLGRREIMPAMNTRPFGKSEYTVGELGLGCWQLGGTDWSGLSDLRAHSILIEAADSGVSFFDTADVSGDGRSEEVLGAFLKERKGQLLVATKVGRAHGMFPSGYTWEAVRTATEASLKRLDLPALPLTQLHCLPTEVLREGEIFDWLRRLKADGKIRHFGASVDTVEQALLCLEQPEISSLQMPYNVFHLEPEKDVFPLLRSKGVALIVRLPFAEGLLTTHLPAPAPAAPALPTAPPPPSGPDAVTFCGLPFEQGIHLASRLHALVPHGMTLPQMALRYLLDQPEVSVVLPELSKPAEAASHAEAIERPPLAPALQEQIRQFYASEVAPVLQPQQ